MNKDIAINNAIVVLERIDAWLKLRYSGIGLVDLEVVVIHQLKEALATKEVENENKPMPKV